MLLDRFGVDEVMQMENKQVLAQGECKKKYSKDGKDGKDDVSALTYYCQGKSFCFQPWNNKGDKPTVKLLRIDAL